MPTSSDEMRTKMGKRFGSIDCFGPQESLRKHGYILSKQWSWSHPIIKSYKDMAQEDYDCLRFLVEEWDYDGLKVR